ncbi:hypothetical protein BSZ35_03075 [Salinibacter sp. 10B]|uniref:hypothetical protein n=1 Tax=Salinibacter sp. 10B TaxID=1923971 RepID=UPI000CF3F663|nr:hypothetical protein [Salinibacter sp. 10B]PQJ33718.1 hypothetical protein BSZ35_03075 [Salinibacter sp. 10B]
MPDEQPNEITFVYEETDEVRTIAATGAHGGPTPDGASVVANLYVERASIPHHVSHQIDERGEVDLSETSQEVARGEVTREVQASLVLTPEHAMQLGQWLQENAQQAMEQRRQTYG